MRGNEGPATIAHGLHAQPWPMGAANLGAAARPCWGAGRRSAAANREQGRVLVQKGRREDWLRARRLIEHDEMIPSA